MPNMLSNGDLVQVTLYCSQGTQQAINRLNFRVKNITGFMDDATLAGLVGAVLGPLWREWMASSAEYRGLRLQIVSPLKFEYQASIEGAGIGAQIAPGLPNQTSMCCRLRTGSTSRFKRGRIYLPFFAAIYNGTPVAKPTAAAKTAAQAALDVLVPFHTYPDGVGNHTDLELIISSKGRPSGVPPVPPSQTVVTSTVIDQEWATQRRRSNINRPDQLGP